MIYELELRGLKADAEIKLPIKYMQLKLDNSFRLDIVVEEIIVLEIKAIDKLNPVHTAQLLSYLKMGEYPLGLLMNFNMSQLIQGIKRITNKPL